MDATIDNRRKCDLCNIEIHRASYQKHLRSKKHLDNQMIIPQNFLNEQSTSTQNTTKQHNA